MKICLQICALLLSIILTFRESYMSIHWYTHCIVLGEREWERSKNEIILCLILKCIYWQYRFAAKGGEMERDLLSALDYRWSEQPWLCQDKTRIQELVLGLQHGYRALMSFSNAFLGHQQEARSELELLGLQLASIWLVSIILIKMPAPYT